jgi:hypothetical protein
VSGGSGLLLLFTFITALLKSDSVGLLIPIA